jgi:hypothetical protein
MMNESTNKHWPPPKKKMFIDEAQHDDWDSPMCFTTMRFKKKKNVDKRITMRTP